MFEIQEINPHISLLKVSSWLSRRLNLCTYVPLVDGILIDTSFPRAQASFERSLSGKRVNLIVNTHEHEDHVGNNALIAEKFKIPIFAPANALSTIASQQKIPFMRNLLWGTPKPSKAQPLGPEITSENFKFDIVPIPGHIDDMVALFEPKQGWLFGGDLFLAESVRIAAPWENASKWIESLEQVIALKPKIFFCYHKGALFNPHERLQKKLDYMKSNHEKIRALHASGRSEAEITIRMFGNENWAKYLLFGREFSRENLVKSHLKNS